MSKFYIDVKKDILFNQYVKRIAFTIAYIESNYDFSGILAEYSKAYNKTLDLNSKFYITKEFKQLCMRFAGESVNQRITACHSFAASVFAVLRILGFKPDLFIGSAEVIHYGSKCKTLDKYNKQGNIRVPANHCWVKLGDDYIEYFQGYDSNIVRYAEVLL